MDANSISLISFFVPGKPVPQPRHRVAVRGRFPAAYIPKNHAVHAWKRQVEACAVAAMNKWEIDREWDKEGAFNLHVNFHLPRPKRNKTQRPTGKPDVDNLLKGVLDAMTGVVWSDDSRIVFLASAKMWSPAEDAGANVTVWHE